jgi:hypothetical protein
MLYKAMNHHLDLHHKNTHYYTHTVSDLNDNDRYEIKSKISIIGSNLPVDFWVEEAGQSEHCNKATSKYWFEGHAVADETYGTLVW